MTVEKLPGSRPDLLERIASAAADYRAIFGGVDQTGDVNHVDVARQRIFDLLDRLADVEEAPGLNLLDVCRDEGVVCAKLILRDGVGMRDLVSVAHRHAEPGDGVPEVVAAITAMLLSQLDPEGRKVAEWRNPG